MEIHNETFLQIMLRMESHGINVGDYVYMLMALFMFAIFIMGLLFNGIFVYILLFHNKLRTRNNIYIITLCVASILIGVLAVPFVGVSAVSHHWLFGTDGCIFHGFIVTWLGLIQICILSVISVEKYLIIVKRNRDDFLSLKATLTLVGACIVYSGMLAIYPLFGWSEYTVGSLNISCEINLSNTTAIFHSYTICLLILELIFPLGVIGFSYGNIFLLVRRRRKNRFANDKYGNQSKVKEVKVIKTIFLLIAAFIISWLPYSGLVFITMFYPYQSINPVLATLPSLFAKSSIIWNPVIYLMTNMTFKRAFKKSIGCKGVFSKVKCDYKNFFVRNKKDVISPAEYIAEKRNKKISVTSTML